MLNLPGASSPLSDWSTRMEKGLAFLPQCRPDPKDHPSSKALCGKGQREELVVILSLPPPYFFQWHAPVNFLMANFHPRVFILSWEI